MDFSTLQLAATSLAITGSKQSAERVSKHDLGHAAGLASTATASIGKFDKKLAGEKAPKNSGKRRKVLKSIFRYIAYMLILLLLNLCRKMKNLQPSWEFLFMGLLRIYCLVPEPFNWKWYIFCRQQLIVYGRLIKLLVGCFICAVFASSWWTRSGKGAGAESAQGCIGKAWFWWSWHQ